MGLSLCLGEISSLTSHAAYRNAPRLIHTIAPLHQAHNSATPLDPPDQLKTQVLRELPRAPAGSLALLKTADGEILAKGYYDPASKLAFRTFALVSAPVAANAKRCKDKWWGVGIEGGAAAGAASGGHTMGVCAHAWAGVRVCSKSTRNT